MPWACIVQIERFIDRTTPKVVKYGARLRGQGASLSTISLREMCSLHPPCSSLACQEPLLVWRQTECRMEAPPRKVSARGSRSLAKLQSGVAWSIANRKTPPSANAVRAAQQRPGSVAALRAWRLMRVAPALLAALWSWPRRARS
jgi:hypothetical protein